MPSAASARLGLTSPLGTEAAAGPANIATLITQLEAAVGMARLSEQTSAGGAGAGLTFAAINQNFRHLRLVGVARSNDGAAGGTDNFRMRVNGAVTLYSSRYWLTGVGAAGGADGAGIDDTASGATTYADLGPIANEGIIGSMVSGFTLDVLDYTAAAIWKTWLYRATRSTSSGAEIVEAAGGWHATNAITDLSMFVATAGLDAISRATLYGLR